MQKDISVHVPMRTPSGVFNTSEGTLYVSKPYRSKSSKALRALITFAPRSSTFDINNEVSVTNEFRGFFSLFWISIFIFAVRTYVRGIETSGRPLNLAFATMFSQHAITLALSDAVLVLSTGVCVPIAFAMKRGWIQYHGAGLVIQHLVQTVILFTAITWTFQRKWPWVQSGFLTLHSLVMIMKMHSYITVNGQLQTVANHSKALFDQLHEATQSVGGWEKALADAKMKSSDSDTSFTPSSINSPLNGTPDVPDGYTSSYVDARTAVALRKRLVAVASQNTNSGDHINIAHNTADTAGQSVDIDHLDIPAPHPLINHPNLSISAMAKDYSELQSELTSPGPLFVSWPDNISWKNFAVYQLVPTLVYELEYPRTDRIRPLYVFEKTVATFGTFALLYTVTETFILPYTSTPHQSFFRALLDLALPFMIAYLLLFYIIFECICNGFAELSYFADRQFYEDWYGNIPDNRTPLTFLNLGGILLPGTSSHENGISLLSRTMAMFLTFLLSACVHELVMVVVTHKFRFYLFILQIVQIPLIFVTRMPTIKKNKLLGNVIFWLGLYAGFPMLCVAYVFY